MWRLPAVLLVFAATSAGCQRPIQIEPQAVDDAQLGARIKTVLVNDAELGPRIIEVRVTRGVVTLSGLVGSASEAERAVELARTVPGVTDVRSRLVVQDLSASPAAPDDGAITDIRARPTRQEASATQRRLLAIGASLNTREPTSDRLASDLTVGPLVRLGTGRGLGITLGFSWFKADLAPETSAGTLGRLTIRPVMGGASYTFTDQARWALSMSLVGGMAFNSFTLDQAAPRDVLALEIDNSFAVRPGVSLWYDVNSRAALNFFTGYVITRPQVTYLEFGDFAKRTVRADTAVVNIGLAYKLF